VVSNGVNEGDQVVVEGADKLQPKSKVEIGGAHGAGAPGGKKGGGKGGGKGGARGGAAQGQS
jgi:hypothetical protein